MPNSNKPMQVAGLSIVTTNEEAFTQNSIGKLWETFLNTPVKEKLSQVASPTLYAVYSDFENGDKGKYRLTIGYAVHDTTTLPPGLMAVTVPMGNHKIYPCKSRMPADIVNTWKTIWAVNPDLHPRSFVADFEAYQDDEVAIHIGYE